MEIAVHPICGIGLGFELIETQYLPRHFDEGQGVYLVVELLILRFVFTLKKEKE